NDGYWGEKSAWQRIVFRPITSAGPRVAALLSGDVDMIENVPIQDLERIKANSSFKVVQGLSARVIYLHFDYIDDAPPGVSGADGKNPVRDRRVAEGVSEAHRRGGDGGAHQGGRGMAGGRAAAADDVRRQQGHEAAQGRVDGAKKLLAEAGYPHGFTVVLG